MATVLMNPSANGTFITPEQAKVAAEINPQTIGISSNLSPSANGTPMLPQQPEIAAEITAQNIVQPCDKGKQIMEDPFAGTDGKEESMTGVGSLNMSRGEKPEADINWPKLETLFVYDEMGNKIKFSDVYRRQKTLIIFVRVS